MKTSSRFRQWGMLLLGGAATVGSGALLWQKGDVATKLHAAVEREGEEEEEDEDRPDRPDLAMAQEVAMTMDPATGTVPRERLIAAQAYTQRLLNERIAAKLPVSSLGLTNWTERGPTNVGGRIRALVVDPTDATGNTLWAGSAGGGLWKTTNATATSPTWTSIDNFFATLAVTAIVFDPANPNIMYFGTGEGFFNADAVRGLGIWKSTDHGVTWTQLPSTTGTTYNYITKLKIHPVTGDLYAATRSGLMRSSNGGTSWTSVLAAGNGSTDSRIADIEISADNTLYVSIGLFTRDGIYRSTTGNAGSWTNLNTLAGSGLPTAGYQRIELACAPSDANRVYAIMENATNNQVLGLYRSNNGGTTWTLMSMPGGVATALASSQAWYDLAAAVAPNNPDQLYVAGLDIFRTLAANTDPVVWQKVSVWSTTPGLPNFVHADHHVITFASADGNLAYFGNDGGVFTAANAVATVAPIFSERNNGLNVTQYYAVAMHPTNVNYFLAGAQDNGTKKYTTAGLNAVTTATGGDGGFCFIDQDEPQFQFSSYVYAQYYRSTNGGASFSSINISSSAGSFINPTDYDSRDNTMYAGYTSGQLLRWPNATTSTATSTIALTSGAGAVSHVTVSPNRAGRVYVGTSSGRVIRIDDATGAAPVVTDLRSGTGTVSCVAVQPGNDNHLLATYSNYGVVSVWETTDGGTSWRSVEGNLPDMPVRWAMFDPDNGLRALLATEMGIWATDNLSANTTWFPASLGMANVRVDMLRMRASDKQIAAATHGRGLFTSDVFTPTAAKSGIALSDKLLDGVYPNPFAQELNVKFQQPVSGEATFTLVDTRGRKVMYSSRRVSGQQVSVPAPDDLAAGVYLLTVRVGNETAVRRVVRR